ncbi:helix-turn-helix transcriptional regulator [Anaerovibrio sp. JC8]|uniref:helix-turn-helix domain-containing protein n=1 Tax=Anaerovibrio sp. JC8 TaxID=1240085 RepID=UPI0018E91162|nr:helix-turn-helix transcriptional regulator [Anaerovibrio sp. JC8]
MKEIEYGRINIKLGDILQEQNISINKLAFRAELQRSQVRGYCKNTIQRIDTGVLARLCHALDCDVSDLIEYIPPDND